MNLSRSILAGVFFLGVAQMLCAQPNHVVISQVYGGGGNSGSTIKNDFIEIYNPTASPVSVSGWSVQYASASGTTWQVTNLSGTIASGAYYLIQEAQGAGGSANLPTPNATGTIPMSASDGKVSLVSSTTALSGSCPTPTVVDRVGYGSANCFEGAGAAPALSATKADVRTPVNADTDNNATDFVATTSITPHNSTAAVSISQLSPDTVTVGSPDTNVTITGSSFGSDSVVNFTGQSSITPPPASITGTSILVTIPASYLTTAGTPSITVSSGGATSGPLTFTISSGPGTCTESMTIAAIQGTGGKSAAVGTTQTAQGIVTYRKSNGFFMQMATGDGNQNTSDAIFVFTSSAPTVQLGDLACVKGNVSEFFNGGALITTDADHTQTEFTKPASSALQVTVISSGNPLPAAVSLVPDPSGAFDQFAKYESMRVKVGTLTVVGPGGVSAIGSNAEANGTYAASGAFWGVLEGTTRPIREPGAESSHPIVVENSTGASYGLLPAAEPIFDSNPERIQVYTGNGGVTVQDVSAGAQVSNIAGVLDVYYGDFEIDEDATTTPGYIPPVVLNNNLTFTAVPAAPASQLTIGAFNLEHFYDDQLNGTGTPFEIALTPGTYQGRLTKASMAIRNVLHTPDILGVVEMENLSTLQTLAAKINSDSVTNGQPNPNYQAFLVEGNDPSGIDVGFLINPARISNASATQYFATDKYNGTTITFDRPPLLLTATAQNTNGAPLPVSVMINHLKALPADDPTDASARNKRQAQAQKLAQFIQDLQTANPGVILAVMGDLNAFEFNDGINDVIGELTGNPAPANQVILPNTNVITSPLTELSVAFLPSAQRYSYNHGGNAQQLDHILVSGPAMSRMASFAVAHLSADFTESLHYDYTRPERLSDHDGEVAYVNLPQAVDVTSSVSVVSSGFILNRGTQLYNGTITVKNNSAATLSAPLQLFFNDLSSTATLANATGYQGGVLPYITTNTTLAPGASAVIQVQFRVQGNSKITYTNNVYSGTL